MDFFDTRYFRINKLFLSFVGLWPYQTSFMKILTLSFAIYGVTITCLPQIVYLFKHTDDLDNLVELMPTLTGGIICVMKVISLIYNSEKALLQFKMLLQHIREDWNNLLTKQEIQILTHYADNSRKFTLAYSISIFGFVWSYSLIPLIAPILDVISPLNETRPKKFPQLGEYFLNQEKYYYPLMLNICVGYNGMWYDAPIKVQKMLMFLIARSQKVCRITLGKLYVISFQGFSMVMRTSLSYCTVMISLRETS
nr:PREDICTED: uncharacterized protein LOC105677627 [Linepithema humile]